jgi:hypothetical protein
MTANSMHSREHERERLARAEVKRAQRAERRLKKRRTAVAMVEQLRLCDLGRRLPDRRAEVGGGHRDRGSRPWLCKNASSRTIGRTNFSEVAPGTRKLSTFAYQSPIWGISFLSAVAPFPFSHNQDPNRSSG